MEFNSPYWWDLMEDKISTLQRWILTHSYLYYELDTSIVNDYMFDMNCHKLKSFSDSHQDALKRSRYYYAMKDFDGSSGYGFFNKLNEDHKQKVIRDALMLKERY